ncbi:CAPA peptides-like isoform X2 [Pogonomyrmex barbatus]|uniref:CAPA peptides-like isoform X2 n=1 Tax=Pogonomyrmex barbatus TaxID=144034 RepID=A0A6I9VSV1_9HYME|nr:CAPA peptides-like isoform X2 [Pogonomyrmex barbatus]
MRHESGEGGTVGRQMGVAQGINRTSRLTGDIQSRCDSKRHIYLRILIINIIEMQDNRFFIFVVFLAFSTSLNQGQKLKINDRRSAGLVPYPRIGRNSEIAGFPRSERTFGIVNTPRVGRSDVTNLGNLNRFHDSPTDADIDFYTIHDTMERDILSDLDYEEYADADRPIAFKYADKIQKDNSWLMPDHVHGYKDLRLPQKIDSRRSYYSILRGSRNTQGQGGYTPRLGRENEHDTANFL